DRRRGDQPAFRDRPTDPRIDRPATGYRTTVSVADLPAPADRIIGPAAGFGGTEHLDAIPEEPIQDSPMLRMRAVTAFVGLCLSVGSAVAADVPTIAVEVDARELPRKLLHTTLDIPCKPGPLRLWYPRWFPGSHGPHGRVEDVAGFRVEAPDGTSVPWTR